MTPDVLLLVNSAVLGGKPEVRDAGLVAAAAARPHANLSGAESYPSIEEKAAALLHSIVRTRPFQRGNTSTGWVALRMMLRCHGKRPGLTATEAFDLLEELRAVDLSVPELVAALRVIDD
ncbi:Fic family protein [Nocardia sp. NPDC004604]|uniref:type II toxin-antitoxin system death-on-curing family toxin n=1 Tax=Nocardia sp. NPDC004604 TaxID=3157013 RepID=UPI0033BADD4F